MADQSKDKSVRYDRQIRLWGENAQELLGNTNMCLVNATAAGCEALKNLVLPGIKAYTVLDGAAVTERDLGSSFFVARCDVGQPRAKVTSERLQELNELVAGSFLEDDPVAVVNDRLDWFKQFTGVLVTRLPEPTLLKLAAFLEKENIPLFVITVNGLVASLRIQAGLMCIMETKPEHSNHDLRLNAPWPELAAFAEKRNQYTPEIQGNGGALQHIPFIVLLITELKKWKEAHGSDYPSNRKEQDEFKKQVSDARIAAMKVQKTIDNWDEAMKNIRLAWMNPTLISSAVTEVLEHKLATSPTESSSDFWIMAAALKQFHAKHKQLPCAGVLPDFHADTDTYLALQRDIYQVKAQRDLDEFMDLVNEVLTSVGRSSGPISEKAVKMFCKNARFLEIRSTKSLAEEYTSPSDDFKEALGLNLMIQPGTEWYIILRAVERFKTQHDYYPGAVEPDTDIPLLSEIVGELCKELGVAAGSVPHEDVHEVCRFGGSETHCIAAVIGGVAAQEIIKVVAGPVFQPLADTFIFNGITATGVQLK